MDKINERHIAIHEAAHFITLIVGYGENESGPVPEKISIIGNGNGIFGYIRVPAHAQAFVEPELMSNLALARQIVFSLAGYAAEEVYCEDATLEIGDDHGNAAFLAEVLAARYTESVEDKTQSIIDALWEDTVNLLKSDIITKAVSFIADQLQQMREIEGPAIIELIEQVAGIPGFNEARLVTPNFNRTVIAVRGAMQK